MYNTGKVSKLIHSELGHCLRYSFHSYKFNPLGNLYKVLCDITLDLYLQKQQ